MMLCCVNFWFCVGHICGGIFACVMVIRSCLWRQIILRTMASRMVIRYVARFSFVGLEDILVISYAAVGFFFNLFVGWMIAAL